MRGDLVIQERRISVGEGLSLNVMEAGSGPLLLMIHGFPGLAYSWRHQMLPFASAGFRAVAIDSLGYGASDRPADPALYDSAHMQAYLTALLDHYGARDAVVIGQDFGAQYAWNMAVRSPERVRALIATIPYDYDLAGRAMLGGQPRLTEGEGLQPDMASPDHSPSARFAEMAKAHFVHFHYFQTVGPADRELGNALADYLRRSFHALSASGDLWAWKALPSEGTGYLDALPPAPDLPWSWLSAEEFAEYVRRYDHPDIDLRMIGGLNSYRTADANWEIGRAWADADVTVPTLMLYGAADPSFGFFPDWEERLRRRVPGLADIVTIEGAGHLVQQEAPEAFNAAVLRFLDSVA